MARDYASRQRKRIKPETKEVETKAPAKARGAVARSIEEKTSSPLSIWSRLPGWGWLTLGIFLGFLVAQFGQSTAPTPLEEKPPLAVIDPKATSHPVEKIEKVEKKEAAPRFDFYTLLPESEVVAPEVEAYKSTPREAANQPRYMVQVGSFRSQSDAKKQQERLKSLGFDQIQINEIETGSGDVWSRVQIGPYQDRRILARAQNDLAKAGLDFMLLKLRDEPLVEQSVVPKPTNPN